MNNNQNTQYLLITGGCGFIGSNLIDFMIKKGFTNLRILDNFSVGKIENTEAVLAEHGKYTKKVLNNQISYTLISKSNTTHTHNNSLQSLQINVDIIIGDIRNLADCLKSTDNASAVVHLAAQSGVPISVDNPMLDCELNIVGTLNILEACRKNKVDKFIFASSGAPLGEVDPPIHENKVPKPVSPYGASKLAGEAYCSAYYQTFGIKTVALRFGNIYGLRSSHKSSVVAKFFKRAMEGLPLEIYGDGSQTRDFVFTNDICNAIYLSLKSTGIAPENFSPQPSATSYSKTGGEIFQIATYKETTVDEIAKKIKMLVEQGTNKKVEIKYGEKRLGDVRRNYSDISKATEILGFKPEYDLDTGLNKTWQFYLNSTF